MANEAEAEIGELIVKLREKLTELELASQEGQGLDLPSTIARELSELRGRLDQILDSTKSEGGGEERTQAQTQAWERVKLARHPSRPTTLDYIEMLMDDFYELHGDRLYGDDGAIVGGLAKFAGRTIAVVGHQKGRDPEENRLRRWGMAGPGGYRKALRIMRLGERFRFPILSFIDTPGAYPGREAEEHNIGGAIADSIQGMLHLQTPIVVAIIGEGGSGGAIALGVGDRCVMLENAYYSVISPEGCAAILWRDREKAPEAAAALKLTAPDLLKLGVIDEIVKEPPGGAHTDPQRAAQALGEVLLRHLEELEGIEPGELQARRLEKYRRMGIYKEAREVIEIEALEGEGKRRRGKGEE